ncbi:hypothetical protein V2J09_021797 [Rumex salicifolius]
MGQTDGNSEASSATVIFDEEFESKASDYLELMYSEQLVVTEMVKMLSRFKDSSDPWFHSLTNFSDYITTGVIRWPPPTSTASVATMAVRRPHHRCHLIATRPDWIGVVWAALAILSADWVGDEWLRTTCEL